jgi:hypothetical protein
VARLFADENFPFPVVEALRRIGHNVITVADAGKAGQALTDKAILELAAADQRAVVTLNRRHFVQLHVADPQPRRYCRVLARSRLREPGGPRIDQMIATEEPLAGRLLRVNRPQR